MNLREQFKIYSDKGPVNVPGAQRKFEQVSRLVEPHLTESELSELGIARGHAVGPCQEGRREWDSICAKIRKRLFND